MLLSYAVVEFYLFYDGAVDMQIWASLTRRLCRVSDTQVIGKARGPLVFILKKKELNYFYWYCELSTSISLIWKKMID